MFVYLKRILGEAIQAGLLALATTIIRQLVYLILGEEEPDSDHPLEC